MKHPEIFEEHFLEEFVKLGSDKVPNVRILLVNVLLQIKQNMG